MPLSLTRKPGEQIAIGDDIVVTIVDVHSCNRVKVLIEAPRDIIVDRMEVYRDKRNQELREKGYKRDE